MDTHGLPIELDENVPFIEDEWIRLGKKYAKAPDFVRWKKDEEMVLKINYNFFYISIIASTFQCYLDI